MDRVVCPKNFFDSQNGTLSENFFCAGGGGGGRRKFLSKGPPTQNMPKGHVFLRYATALSICFSRELNRLSSVSLGNNIRMHAQTTSGTPVQIRKIRTTVRIRVFTDRLSTNQNREF